jgi:plastocyanin
MAAHIIRGRMTRTLIPAVAIAIALGGCGSNTSKSGGGQSKTLAAGTPIKVTADEFRFDPNSVVLNGSGGGQTPVSITLRNEGAQAHDLRIMQGGQDLGGTATFGPGQVKTATVNLKPGSYVFECTVDNHAEMGMKGKLVVK